MYERKTAIPMRKGESEFKDSEMPYIEKLEATHSMCDEIKEIDNNEESQIMEVIEHILHHVTMVGLHYTYFNEWGVSKTSDQY